MYFCERPHPRSPFTSVPGRKVCVGVVRKGGRESRRRKRGEEGGTETQAHCVCVCVCVCT
jgi:hypothetical protein